LLDLGLVVGSLKESEHGRAGQLQPARRRRGRRRHIRRRRRRLRLKKASAARLRAAAQAQSLAAVQLLGDLLDRVGADGHHDAVRDGAPVRGAGDDGVRLAHCRRLHHRRRPGHGRDLLRLPDLRRPLLLERQALQRAPLGPLRLLAHRMWAVTTSVDYSLAQLIQVIILLSTGGNNGGGYLASKYEVIAIHAAILLSHALINSLPIAWLSFFGQFAAAWNMLGVFVLMIAVPAVATERASAKFVFTNFNTDNGAGIHSHVYIFLLGLLMSQYTLLGYDASAHMTEETKNADKNGPIGIISAIGISIVVGWGYILGVTFAVKDIPSLLSPDNEAGGYAIAQVFYQAFKSRYGSGVGGIVCLGIVAVAIYFCGMSSVTSNSRMAYAFSRDGAMPLSSVWHKVNEHEVPINAVWLSAFVSLCMALPSLGSLVAFQAMVSIATIGLYIAYALPIFFRVTLARKHFVPGPFNLGRYGVLVGWVAVLWVVTITVLFSLPVMYPVTRDTLNYTPVAVGGLFILVLTSWVVSARHWFKGPVTNLSG
uniref:Amino acid permease/ SLC12A domain-containing protein n=3 Tax=Aegilops tauschii subsp. strangulata TaxID=200361 RepID=A0A453E358_AEGTS